MARNCTSVGTTWTAPVTLWPDDARLRAIRDCTGAATSEKTTGMSRTKGVLAGASKGPTTPRVTGVPQV